MTSIIIPAHNEASVIGRLLDSLLRDSEPEEFDVLVVSNGSTDGTARIAGLHPGVQVIEIPEASKNLALIAGDNQAVSFPRLYVDADVVVDTAGARALVNALAESGILVVAPTRDMVLDGSSWAVRAYYRVWSRLPAVKEGLFGRGVLGVNQEGFSRISSRPDVIGDDLFLHSQFSESERRIVADSSSRVWGPRTLGDLTRRRARAAQGNSELSARTAGRTDSTTGSAKELLRLVATEPGLWTSLPAFVAVTVRARARARRLRRSGSQVWLRDESSRAP